MCLFQPGWFRQCTTASAVRKSNAATPGRPWESNPYAQPGLKKTVAKTAAEPTHGLRLIIKDDFFLSEPVAFRRVYGLESYSRTSGESNHHRQSVSDTRVPRYQLSHEDDCLIIKEDVLPLSDHLNSKP